MKDYPIEELPYEGVPLEQTPLFAEPCHETDIDDIALPSDILSEEMVCKYFLNKNELFIVFLTFVRNINILI